jgi:PAS domain S-box-containing protein
MTSGVTPIRSDPGSQRAPVLLAARVVGLGVTALGGAVLLGWQIDSPALRSFGAGVSMNPASAVCFGLIGLSLWTLTRPFGREGLDRAGLVAAGLAAAICAARLIAYLAGWTGGLDRILFAARLDSPGELFPNRMAPNTAVCILLLSAGLTSARMTFPAARRTTAWLCLPVALIAGITIAGYGYDVRALSRVGHFIPMAINTAVGLASVAIVMPLLRPPDWLAGVFGGDGRTLRSKVNWGLGVGIAIVVLTGGVSLGTSLRSRAAGHQRRESDGRLTLVRQVLRLVEITATRELRLLQRGDPADLAGYRAAADSLRRLERDLRATLADPGGGGPDLARAVRAYLAESDTTIAHAQAASGQPEIGRTLASADAIRSEADRMAGVEAAAVSQWDQVMTRASRAALVTSAAAIVFAILFLLLAGRAIHHDLGAREAAEAGLRESERRLAQVIEFMPQSVTLKEPTELRYVGINRAAEQLAGVSRAAVLGRNAADLLPADRALVEMRRDREALANRTIVDVPEEELDTPDRGPRFAHTKRVPLLDTDQHPILLLSISQDITDRRLAEQALERARTEAEAANRAKSDFLAKMSHELRTPLNSIIGFSEILEAKRIGPLNDKQERYVGNVLTSGRNLLRLINDILDLSKVEAGRMTLTITEFDAKTVLDEVRATMMPLAERKQQVIQVVAPADLPRLAADHGKVTQILYNLVSNAIKFTPDGGQITLSAALGPRSEFATGAELEFGVADTGIGIKFADRERIWHEFVQVEDVRTRSIQGTGLGLALCRKLVDLHRGRIWVEGAPGRGSTFRFTLPYERQTAPGRIGPPPEKRNGEAPLILVVDDEPQARDLIAHYLLETGYRVADAASGEQAVALAARLRPSAITLDIRLPGWDGFDVLTHLKNTAETENIPVVIVSVTDQRPVGIALGAVDWLVKPVQAGPLMAVLRRAMDTADQRIARTVLIIDDDPAVREVVADLLDRVGVRVLTATGGREGIQLALREVPDAIILDLIMPDLSGFDVLRELQADPIAAGIPVLVLTSKDLTPEERAQLDLGAEGVVSKSSSQELLRELLRVCPLPAPLEATHG